MQDIWELNVYKGSILNLKEIEVLNKLLSKITQENLNDWHFTEDEKSKILFISLSLSS